MAEINPRWTRIPDTRVAETGHGDPRDRCPWEASLEIGEAEEARGEAEEAAILPWAPSTATQGRVRAVSAEEKTATGGCVRPPLPLLPAASHSTGAHFVASLLTGTSAQAPDSGARLLVTGFPCAVTMMPGAEMTSHLEGLPQTLAAQVRLGLRTARHRTGPIHGGNQTHCTDTKGRVPTRGGRCLPCSTGNGPGKSVRVGPTWEGLVRTVRKAEALGIRTDSLLAAQEGETGGTQVPRFPVKKTPLEHTWHLGVVGVGGVGTGAEDEAWEQGVVEA